MIILKLPLQEILNLTCRFLLGLLFLKKSFKSKQISECLKLEEKFYSYTFTMISLKLEA